MKFVILLYGPSGLVRRHSRNVYVEKYSFKQCDPDYFKLAFSPHWSKVRSQIKDEICYAYVRELIRYDYSVVVEAIEKKSVTL